jgi:hypothetical protein
LGIKSARVKLLNNNAGKMGLKNQGQELTLEKRRALLGPHGKEVDIRVQKNGQRAYL